MLKMTCNRCEADLGKVVPSSVRRPDEAPELRMPDFSSRFQAPLFSELGKRLEYDTAPMDLCEKCARELVEALSGWLPAIGEAQRRLAERQAEYRRRKNEAAGAGK